MLIGARYRLDALIGRGGLGEVYRGHDTETDREVALKTVRTDVLGPFAARLFRAEVAAVARLDHPGIVPVYDVVIEPPAPAYLVMGFSPGRPLADWIPRGPAWPFVRTVLRQVLAALAHAHSRSVLHLDVTPNNILIEEGERGPRAILVDFGIARVKRPGYGIEAWVEGGGGVGTVAYAAPEQIVGSLDEIAETTDLYSVGSVAYELLSGLPPFGDDPQPRLEEPRAAAPPLLPLRDDVPAAVIDLCARLLAVEPRDRPALASDVIAELDAMADGARATEVTPPPDEAAAPEVVRIDTTAPIAPQAAPTVRVTPPDMQRAAGQPDDGMAAGLFGLRDAPLVARDEQRRALAQAVDRAIAGGRARFVLLSGPAGAGKTRLARAVMESAREAGRCSLLETAWSPGQPSGEALRGLIENLLDTRGGGRDRVRTRLRFWLSRVPGDHSALAREIELFLRPPPDASFAPGSALRLALSVVRCAARLRPGVILLLDDVHAGDGDAAALIQALLDDPGPLPVCIVATAREEWLADAAALAAPLLSQRAQVIQLGLLDASATQRLVAELLPCDPELAAVVGARSEGNPLFATLLLRELIDSRRVVRHAGSFALAPGVDPASGVPGDVARLWDERIDRAGARRDDLLAIAMLRRPCSVAIAAQLARVFGPAFDDSLARAHAAGLLRLSKGAYAWGHGLCRDHLLRAGDADRPRLAERVAEALRALVGTEDVEEERGHLLWAAGRAEPACEAMIAATQWAFRRADLRAARACLDTLRAWADATDATGGWSARALAETAFLDAEQGNREKALACITEAEAKLGAAGRPDAACWVVLRRAHVQKRAGLAQEGFESARQALELAERAGIERVQALALLVLSYDWLQAGDPRGSGAAERAAELFRAIGDRANEAQAVRQIAAFTSDAEQGLALIERAIALARDAGAVQIELGCEIPHVSLLMRVGRRGEARDLARRIAAEARRVSIRQLAAMSAVEVAALAIADGDWAEARTWNAAAAAAGAQSGNVTERKMLAVLEVALAIHDAGEETARAAFERFEAFALSADTWDRLVLAAVADLAPPALAARIRAYCG